MKLDFQFSNLCGTVYKQGNVVFTPDGNCVLSPVGNRISMFDLLNNKSTTFPFENRKNIVRTALSPNGSLLITVDVDGRALLINFPRRIVLHHFNFKAPVKDIQFSPNGKFIAVTHERHIQVWRAPGFTREFAPFVLHRTYTGHYDDVLSITWKADSKYFLTTSKDMTARMYSVDPVEGFSPVTLTGHRDAVVAAWWNKDETSIYTVSKDGAVFVWKYGDKLPTDEDGNPIDIDDIPEKLREKRWRIATKHYFNHNHSKVVSASFHVKTGLLIVGFSTGIFGIWELPDFTNIHSLSVSQKRLDACAISPSGDWLAFASSKLGQLLIWEWSSETYILKQQGHYYDVNTVSYSHDGQFIVTGSDDGKVKLWNVFSGFCFVTFDHHSSAVTRVEFSKKNQVVFSASLDGTVRAYDLIRYRNFRTFTAPSPTGFASLAVDPSGEILVAGSVDNFEIYVWSVQTGKLLDILSGHEGPISSLAFAPSVEHGGTMVSGSWDKTVKVWDVFARGGAQVLETFEHKSEVLSVAYRHDGAQIAVSTLDGSIQMWDVEQGKMTGVIEGKKDISGGRRAKDLISAENNTNSQHFTSVSYTSDGEFLIAGGNSKYVCIYDVSTKVLLKKFQISNNLSLDGMQEKLNSKNMTEFGALDLMDTDDFSDLEDRLENDSALPGVRNGDKSLRNVRPEVRTKDVKFSPTGRNWAAASTEGLVIFSIDDTLIFDPLDLEMDVTPSTTIETLEEGQYLKALVMALRLSEQPLLQKVFESIPPSTIDLAAQDLPIKYLDRMLKFLGVYMERSLHIDFVLRWVNAIMRHHGKYLRMRNTEYLGVLRAVQRGVARGWEELSKICHDNTYTIRYLQTMGELSRLRMRASGNHDELSSETSQEEEETEVDMEGMMGNFDSDSDEGEINLNQISMDMVV